MHSEIHLDRSDDSTAPPNPGVIGWLASELGQTWAQFEAELSRLPVIARLERGELELDDYRAILFALRQQVVDGSRWITRAASNMTQDAAELRSFIVRHATQEHRDFELLERDYASVGGDFGSIRNGTPNVGSEALSAWMFHRASQENPLALLGALFIIEGLGSRIGRRWGESIRDQLGLDESQVSFFLHRGRSDEAHLERLRVVLHSGVIDETMAREIVRTARVTARLYALQFEEIGRGRGSGV